MQLSHEQYCNFIGTTTSNSKVILFQFFCIDMVHAHIHNLKVKPEAFTDTPIIPAIIIVDNEV